MQQPSGLGPDGHYTKKAESAIKIRIRYRMGLVGLFIQSPSIVDAGAIVKRIMTKRKDHRLNHPKCKACPLLFCDFLNRDCRLSPAAIVATRPDLVFIKYPIWRLSAAGTAALKAKPKKPFTPDTSLRIRNDKRRKPDTPIRQYQRNYKRRRKAEQLQSPHENECNTTSGTQLFYSPARLASHGSHQRSDDRLDTPDGHTALRC